MEYFVAILAQIAVSGPLYLVWLVGIILAVTRSHEAPARYRLVLVALILFLVTALVGTVLNVMLPSLLQDRGYTATQFGLVFGAVGLFRTLVDAVGWVLLLVALFRRPRGGAPQAVRES